MTTLNLPNTFALGTPDRVADAGLDTLNVDMEKVIACKGALDAIIGQGLTYYLQAALSHAKAKANKDAEEPRDLTPEEINAVVNERFFGRLYASEWKAARGEAGPSMPPEDRALLSILREKFQNAGVLSKAVSEKKDAAGKVTRAAKPGVSAEEFIAANRTSDDEPFATAAERAYRAAARTYLTRNKVPAEKIDGALDKGWAGVQKETAAKLRAKKATDIL